MIQLSKYSDLIMILRVWGLDVSPDHDGKGLRSWCLLDDNGRSVLMLTARRRCNRWPKYLKIVQFLLHYGGGSNTEHDQILNGPKLFRWWMVVFSNGWDFFGPNLVFLCTVSVCEWSVLVHSCSYSSDHSKTKSFQYWLIFKTFRYWMGYESESELCSVTIQLPHIWLL